MADTASWTLQDFADAAGKRTDPYPTCEPAPLPNACLGCGEALAGRKAKKTGLPLVFCSRECQSRANRRWHTGPDESAALTMRSYAWGDW